MIVFHYDDTSPKNIMIKQTRIGPAALDGSREAGLPMPLPFPSPPLVILNMVSCFLATAAFAASITLISRWYLVALIPPIVGFFATFPFHLYLYRLARKAAQAAAKGPSEDTHHLPMWCFIYIFLLVALWLVILILEVIGCVAGGGFGVVLTAIISGIEFVVSVFIAMKCVIECWDAEDVTSRYGLSLEHSLSSDPEAAMTSDDDETLNLYVLLYSTITNYGSAADPLYQDAFTPPHSKIPISHFTDSRNGGIRLIHLPRIILDRHHSCILYHRRLPHHCVYILRER
jgi:hypothetical protein